MLTPMIDSEYYLVFQAPYGDITRNNNIFTIKSIRRMSDLITSGEDVWGTYYHRHNIAYTQYSSDVANNIFFYTIATDGGALYTVPSSFITNILDYYFKTYRGSIITIDLGLLPEGEDHTLSMSRLETLVKNEFGVIPVLYDHSSTQTISLTEAQHTLIEIDRANTRAAFIPWEDRYNQLLAQMERLTLEKEALERYITICLTCSDCGVEEDLYNPDPVFVEIGEGIFETMEKVNDTQCCDWTVSLNPLLFNAYNWFGRLDDNFFYLTDGRQENFNTSTFSLAVT